MGFTPIGDALKDKMGEQGTLKKQVQAAEAVDAANNVFVSMFGEELAKHANPLFLKNRTLTVSCSSSAVAQEIRLNQQKIVQNINDELGEKQVDRIRYLI